MNNSKIYKFADDICLVKEICSDNWHNELQLDIENVLRFCDINGLQNNPEKCENLNFSLTSAPPLQSLIINNEPISVVSEHKHLVVVLDKKN